MPKKSQAAEQNLRLPLRGLEYSELICLVVCYPVVRREGFGVWGIHLPYVFPIQWGAKELLTEPSNSLEHVVVFHILLVGGSEHVFPYI